MKAKQGDLFYLTCFWWMCVDGPSSSFFFPLSLALSLSLPLFLLLSFQVPEHTLKYYTHRKCLCDLRVSISFTLFALSFSPLLDQLCERKNFFALLWTFYSPFSLQFLHLMSIWQQNSILTIELTASNEKLSLQRRKASQSS